MRIALQAYPADLQRYGRIDAAKGAEWRFKEHAYSDRLADVELKKMTREDLQEWRDRQPTPKI